jgi:hypothetical protein
VKLIQEYWLVDRHGVRALVISEDASEAHLRQMYYAYSIIYHTRTPMRIVAVDVLGGQHEVPVDSLVSAVLSGLSISRR